MDYTVVTDHGFRLVITGDICEKGNVSKIQFEYTLKCAWNKEFNLKLRGGG